MLYFMLRDGSIEYTKNRHELQSGKEGMDWYSSIPMPSLSALLRRPIFYRKLLDKYS
jgi:hypothetical protein